jgi:hypothetical protein
VQQRGARQIDRRAGVRFRQCDESRPLRVRSPGIFSAGFFPQGLYGKHRV